VILLDQINAASGNAITNLAVQQGAKVIDYDRLVVGSKAAYYVSFDNVGVGKLQGKGLVDALKANGAYTQKPVISELNGGITDNNAKLFKQGYDSVLDPLYANGTFVKAKAGDQFTDWDPVKGRQIFDQMLARNHNDISHYDATPVIDIYGSVQDSDLGFISTQINRLIAETRHDVPRGSQVTVRGQVKTMTGLVPRAVGGPHRRGRADLSADRRQLPVLRDPFIIITALPAALAGIVWMLFLSRTPVSVPALMGAIMCMGVATANSVLVISFARQRMNAGDDALQAALTAGFTRFRPVLMTALAMIVGMVPMALGLGEGAEQNAPWAAP